MNFFVLLEDSTGGLELVTPPLDGTILPGVTRDSILQLTKEWGEFAVSERPLSIREVATVRIGGRVMGGRVMGERVSRGMHVGAFKKQHVCLVLVHHHPGIACWSLA